MHSGLALYTSRTDAVGNRLAMFIAGLRVLGGLGFLLLGIFLATQGAHLEATLSVVAVLAWFAASTEAMNFVLERYS
jgi:hypothetical protein